MPYPQHRIDSLQAYFDGGFHEIRRECEREAIEIIARLDRDLYEQGIDGSIAEIGVLHGASFIGMQHLTEPGTKCLAIDVFDIPDYEMDPTGNGGGRASKAAFTESLTRWGRLEDAVLCEADSLALDQWLLEPFRGRIKIFSIDGMHTKQHTLADLWTAFCMVMPGGIICVDDYGHAAWPLVKEGADEFIERTNQWVTRVDAAHNKLYLRKGNVA